MENTCYASPDRFEAGLMRCAWCSLFWESTDPNPPTCRVRDADGGALARWSWNEDQTATPTATTLSWVKSRQIAYAMARAG